MKIIYDGHVFRWEKTGGIRRYFGEVIARLPADWTPTILGVEAQSNNLPHHPQLTVGRLSGLRPRRVSQAVTNFWWQRRYLEKAQVFHPTYYGLSAGLRLADIKCPLVVTVHDFIHATYPQLMDGAASTIEHQRELMERADHLICISQATQRDLQRFHPGLVGKSSVIYHGSSFTRVGDAPTAPEFKEPTFLFVGGREGYKNFQFLLGAFAQACEKNTRLRLQVVGPPLTPAERWQLHGLGIGDRVAVAVNPDEATLQRYYCGCTALLYPSRHEGFGIPPLEAMACGAIAVTANTTSLPEVVGDGGIMLDPGCAADWTECLLQLANGGVRRDELIARARARAALFSWEKSAAQHQAVYQQFA